MCCTVYKDNYQTFHPKKNFFFSDLSSLNSKAVPSKAEKSLMKILLLSLKYKLKTYKFSRKKLVNTFFIFLLRKIISPVVEGPDLMNNQKLVELRRLVEPLIFNMNRPNKTSGLTTGLPTKDETSQTIVRNLFSPFSCIQGSLQAKTVLFLCLIVQ